MDNQQWTVQNLTNLPLELQFQIFSHLDIKSHITLRKVNQDYNLRSNQYWQSELKKLVFKAEKCFFRTTQDSLLYALKISTEIFVQNGYQTKFWDCLLACLLRREQKSLCNLTESTFKEFLLNFYKEIDKLVYNEFPQYLRSLYVMQILHLLKCFPSSQLSLRACKIGLNIQATIEDVWLGTSLKFSTRNKVNFIPVILAELLYSYRFQRTSAFVKSYQGRCFMYGYECKRRKQHFHTKFDIYIEGTKELKYYIEAWICGPDDLVFFPRRIFIEYFRFGLGIEVKGFVKNLWPQRILLELD